MRAPVSLLPVLLLFTVQAHAAVLRHIGSLSAPRADHTAFLLDDGCVALIGGAAVIEVVASTVLPTEVPISAHAAVRLSDGRILIAGGSYTGIHDPLVAYAAWGNNRAEIYDPFAGAVSTIGAMNRPRMRAQATLLADGRVLITGGFTQEKFGGFTHRYSVTDRAEIFDPATGAFRIIGPMRSPRYCHTATLLRDGRVLIAGGSGQPTGLSAVDPLASTEIFDLRTETFEDGPAMGMTRLEHTATLLNDGRVLIVGFSGAEIFDPSRNVFSHVTDLGQRYGHTATLLHDGRVLLFGGASDAIIYDVTEDRVVERIALPHPRRDHAATLLQDGSVLITGGRESSYEAASTDVLRFVAYERGRRRAVRGPPTSGGFIAVLWPERHQDRRCG